MLQQFEGNRLLKYESRVLTFKEKIDTLNFDYKGWQFPRPNTLADSTINSGSIQLDFSSPTLITIDWGDGIFETVQTKSYQSYLNTIFISRVTASESINVFHDYADHDDNKVRTIKILIPAPQLLTRIYVSNLGTFNLPTQVLNWNIGQFYNLKTFHFVGTKLKTLDIPSIVALPFLNTLIFEIEDLAYPLELFSAKLVTLGATLTYVPGMTHQSTRADKFPLLKETLISMNFRNIWGDDFTIPDNFRELYKVTTMGFYGCRFTVPPTVLGYMPALTDMNINATPVTSWGDFPNAAQLKAYSCVATSTVTRIPSTLPAWFWNTSALRSLDLRGFAEYITDDIAAVQEMDKLINNLYEVYDAKASKLAPGTGYRQVGINISRVSLTVSIRRPSGTYQQPAGFIKATSTVSGSNGTPASPQEKIWVMVNQYGHSFTLSS